MDRWVDPKKIKKELEALSPEEQRERVRRMYVVDEEDPDYDGPEVKQLEDIPPGPKRDEVERKLAELRERRERETGPGPAYERPKLPTPPEPQEPERRLQEDGTDKSLDPTDAPADVPDANPTPPPTPPPTPKSESNPPPADPDPDASDPEEVRPAMSEREIRAAGLSVDVPFEAPPPRKGPVLRYASGKTISDVHRERHPDHPMYRDREAPEDGGEEESDEKKE